MLTSYLKIAFRNLLRDRIYSLINIVGLGVGIAISILLLLWSLDELSYDRFHREAANIYHVNTNFDNNGNNITWTYTPAPIAVFGKNEIPDIREAVRTQNIQQMKIFTYKDTKIVEKIKGAYVDENFFRVFDFPLTQGNGVKPFPDTKSIILSETMAQKLFKGEEPLGKVIQIDNDQEFTVSGIIKDMPANSSIQYSVLFPFKILIDNFKPDYWKSLETNWGNYFYDTYLLLNSTASTEDVAGKLTDIHRKNQSQAGDMHYTLQPLIRLHLYAADLTEDGIQTVRIFLIVAIALLIIACINYINLTTARATRRAKEVGVRKTIGADRIRLVVQFLTESAIISVLAFLLSLILIQLIMPFYNELSNKQLTFDLLDRNIILTISTALFSTWIISGMYPAVVLSAFQPVQILRGKLSGTGRGFSFRKLLVVIQFTLSIAIIIATLVVGQQLNFIRNKKLGFNRDNIFTFGMGKMYENWEGLRSEMLRHPGIEAVALGNQSILSIDNSTGDTNWDGKPEGSDLIIRAICVDQHFMKTLGLELVAGRDFTGLPADSSYYILNETAIKEAGIKDPIGKSFSLWDRKGTILGVVKDFNHQSIHHKIEPTIFFFRDGWAGLVYVKTDGQHNSEAVALAEKLWKRYNTEYPFDYQFIDAKYDQMYKREQHMSKLFTAFSVVTIFISCLGLFGLATATATQRMKEIGIRKVVGASVSQIVVLLSKDFVRLVFIALLLASPLAYFAMKQWLQNFAYHVSIHWSVFVVAGASALILTFATVCIKTIQTANVNPVKSLKSTE